MRHLGFAIGLSAALLWSGIAAAFEIEARQQFGRPQGQPLRILSTADIEVFAPVIEDFIAANPATAVDYVVASSAQVMHAVAEGAERFDLVISSAMDLQTKLVNDGYARPHRSVVTADIPAYARWRDHLYAFTREPAVMVLNPQAFEGLEMPRSRQALISLLRAHPERFRGRIGTYDPRRSGLGYLLATQDSRTSDLYWRLTEIMGLLEARHYCCSSDMIEDVTAGRLAMAYNVLGSYAKAHPRAGDLAIIEPEDFTTIMLRTALVPRQAASPDLAGAFLDHLLIIAWRDRALEGFGFERPSGAESRPNDRPIRLDPGLLVYLDRMKKARFLVAWENAILPP